MSQTSSYNGWIDLPTIQSKEIITELIESKENHKATLLISNTGLGKTNSIKLFQKRMPSRTYVITVGDSYKLIHVLNAILDALEIKWLAQETIHGKLFLITNKLKDMIEKGGNPIIILDEAENLKPQTLKAIKELYDAIIEFCSIVLIGTEQILDAMLNRKNKNRQSVPQLYRRFKAGIRIITPLNKARDFRPFFEKYIPGAKDVQDLVLTLADNYGELHDYLHPVLQYAAKKSKPVTEELFRLIHKLPPKSK